MDTSRASGDASNGDADASFEEKVKMAVHIFLRS